MKDGHEIDSNDCESEIKSRVSQAIKAYRERTEKAKERVPGIETQYSHFAQEACEDLEYLTSKGADPYVILHIVFDIHLMRFKEEKWGEKREEELRRLSSKKYWSRIGTRLRQSHEVLREFTTTELFWLWSQFYKDKKPVTNLEKVCRSFGAAAESVREALETVESLKLEKDGWEARWSFDGPDFVRTGKTGKRKSGARHDYNWGELALELYTYLKAATGEPHLAHICLVLRHAGVDQFFDGGQTDKERLSKRLKALQKDELVKYAINARMADYGVRKDRK
jgi:hypothetical protein